MSNEPTAPIPTTKPVETENNPNDLNEYMQVGIRLYRDILLALRDIVAPFMEQNALLPPGGFCRIDGLLAIKDAGILLKRILLLKSHIDKQ